MILTEKEINRMPANLGTLWLIKKSHLEAIDKIKSLDPTYYISKWEYYEDRSDRLAVIADALAVCCDPEYLDWWMDRCLEQAARAARAEAKLRELVDILDVANDEIFHSVDEYTGEHLEGCLLCRIEAALKAAKEG